MRVDVLLGIFVKQAERGQGKYKVSTCKRHEDVIVQRADFTHGSVILKFGE